MVSGVSLISTKIKEQGFLQWFKKTNPRIRDPGKKFIPDPGGKKAPDPGSATLAPLQGGSNVQISMYELLNAGWWYGSKQLFLTTRKLTVPKNLNCTVFYSFLLEVLVLTCWCPEEARCGTCYTLSLKNKRNKIRKYSQDGNIYKWRATKIRISSWQQSGALAIQKLVHSSRNLERGNKYQSNHLLVSVPFDYR
jgi:hypothetical protein